MRATKRATADEAAAIEVRGLTKRYGRTEVLSGLDLSVAAGSVFCLLGPNGAGKTTTVRILATLLRADAGTARVAGHDVVRERRQVRRHISLTGQFAAVDELLTGEENLRTVARLRGLPRAAARSRARSLLDQFALAEAGGRRVATYSGGMRRRLDIAAGLVTPVRVLFLDEPTTGLDPRSRRTMWHLVEELAASGATVLLTTQYLEEAERLADRIAVLDGGRIIAEGTVADLKQRIAGQRLDLTLTDNAAYTRVLGALDDHAAQPDPERLSITVATGGGADGVRALLDAVDPHRVDVARFTVRDATLDDVFLSLTDERPAHV
ncbi:ATP-binding cassette domain-containing protein [Streptomyces sp. 549]|uniref:ABC transporter ATP-binding protein n=1 Tax=Streptomyces sp. 549 TaxID=3049076 RepID=UPI0024C27801|nr:ATP-binding cassette domain-containing protein [Streptomyces sp. 549]MDK1471975.1 ATP-binding cassette domain-containing protein [Streptomyces sp. 549]